MVAAGSSQSADDADEERAPSRARRAAARAERLRARTLAVASSVPGYPSAVAALDRDRRSGGGLLAGALAFRLFGALLPLALLMAVLLGYAATVDKTSPAKAGEAVGIRETLLESVAQSSKLSTGTRWTVAAFAVVALLWSVTAAARAIRAAHSLAWERGVRRLGRALPAGLVLLVAIGGFVVVWGAVGRARAELGAEGELAAVLAVVPFFLIWLALARLLPHGDAPWTALVPGAVLVACGMQVMHLGTVLFVSGRVERASETYGPFGVAFTILLWLYLLSRVIVGSAMLNAALWERQVERRASPQAGGAPH